MGAVLNLSIVGFVGVCVISLIKVNHYGESKSMLSHRWLKDKQRTRYYSIPPENQHAWGVVSPYVVKAWLGLGSEELSLVAKFLPDKCTINSLSAKFAYAESKRKAGGLP